MRLGIAAALVLCFGITQKGLAQRIAGPHESSAMLFSQIRAGADDSALNTSMVFSVRSSDHRWSGAAIGGVTGAALGAIVGAVACSQDDTGSNDCLGVTLGVSALLALPGAILGGIIGTNIPNT